MEQPDDLVSQAIGIDAGGCQDLGREAVAYRESDDQVLAPEEVVTQGQRLASGQVDNPSGVRGERLAPTSPSDRVTGRHLSFERSPQSGGIGPAPLQRSQPDVAWSIQDAEKEVLGPDAGVAQ